MSSESGLPVDQKGVVTANGSYLTTRVTVSVPGTQLSASAFVSSLGVATGGGGSAGGSGGGLTGDSRPGPNPPSTYSSPLSTSSFNIHVTEPATINAPIKHYLVTVGNAPGTPTFTIPYAAGTVVASVPPAALLNPNTTYPYSVVAVDVNNKQSTVVNAYGTTLLNLQPTNLIGGSSSFAGVVPVPANTAVALNTSNGNALQVGDASGGESLTVTFTPTNASFGTVSLASSPAIPATVTVTGGGTNADPLVITGPRDDVNTALNNFVYTPQNGFVGSATVTMTAVDTVEGAVTPDDTDTLVFSVNSATPTPPQNLMNDNPTFSSLYTAVNTDLTLEPLSNSELNVADENGQTLTTVLTPTHGTLALLSIPAGVTVTGAGTSASPLQLVGPPHYINAALNGGLTFTPENGYSGLASIQMVTTAPDGTDTDTVNIEVIQPSNLFNGSANFPNTPQRMAKSNTTLFDGSTNKALSVLYPPTSVVRVQLTLTDGNGNNPGAAANGSLTLQGTHPNVTVTNNGTADVQLEGPVTDLNSLLSAGVLYSPFGSTVGQFRLRMNSEDINVPALTDTNDLVLLEVSEPPQNRYNNSATAFPPISAAIELGFDTPLTFASFFGTALSVSDGDSSSLTVTLTPDANGQGGILTRANTNPIPTGVTVTSGTTTLNAGSQDPITATTANPLVITGSPTQINAFLNNGLVFTPPQGYSGPATVTMVSNDGGGSDTDIVNINVLPAPENRRNDNPSFTTTPILSAPGVTVNMDTPVTRLLSVRNYPSAANVEITLSIPAGKGTLNLNGFAGTSGTQAGVTYAGLGSNSISLVGVQSALNLALQNLRYTPSAAAVSAPETVTMTMRSTGGTLGDYDPGDAIPYLISNPPLNSYRGSTADTNFPAPASRLAIFADQALVLDDTATTTQPAAAVNVVDDSAAIKVILTPANTAGNTGAQLDLTAAVPGTVTVTGLGTNASPLQLFGPTADVQTVLGLLRYTPQSGFTGNTSFSIQSFDCNPLDVADCGPSPDSNTLEINVKPKPQNEFNTTTTTFPVTPIPLIAGVANPIADDGTGVNTAIHEIGVRNLSAYDQPSDTATVRLQIPSGTLNVTLSGGVTISAGANGSGDLTLSATGSNIANLNTVLGTLTWTPPADAVTEETLTITHGPVNDVDTLILKATRLPRNLYNGSQNFPTSRLVINEGTPFSFNGAHTVSVGSESTLTEEDSPSIRVTLTPSLIGTQESGTVSVTAAGAATVSGSGTHASPLEINGSPADVNATLASLSFNSAAGANGNAEIAMVTTDFSGRDSNDLILLDVRAQPSNRFRMPSVNSGNATNSFPGTANARNVPLNSNYLFDNFDGTPDTQDRPQVQVEFYNAADTVTVDLSLTAVSNPATGSLQVTSTNSTVTGNNSAALRLVGTQANVNADLQTLRFNAPNSAGTVDLEMRSTNGVVGDNTANQDVIRLNVENSVPTNLLTGANSGFVNVSGNTPLPLRTVSDTTTVDDVIDFGQTDSTSAASGNFTVTANTWPTLSVSDDDNTVTTRLTPPTFGTLSDRVTPSTPFAGLGLTSVSGTGTNADPFILVGSPANISAALLRLRFTPNAGVANGTSGDLVIRTEDGAAQVDMDNINILVERPTVPETFSGNPNPSGTLFRAVYQFGRDKLPQIVVNDITVSGKEIQDGAQVEIIRYNDNDPTTTADDDTDVLRTVTLNNPNAAQGESVAFNNQTNRATVTVDFSAAGSPVLPVPGTLNDGTGKIGGRLVGGNVDTPSASSVTAANHPWFFFVRPENAQYAVEDYFANPPSGNNRGRWYLINTSTSVGSGLGRLSMVFDSNGTLSLQAGRNATTDVTTGLAKNPQNGDVYYIDAESGNGRLIRWIPSRGIENDRGGSGSATDPFLRRGTLSVNNGSGTTYNFNDKPARLVFNSTVNGTNITPTLYASAGFVKNDGTGNLSGFYRLTNFEGADVSSGSPVTETPIRAT